MAHPRGGFYRPTIFIHLIEKMYWKLITLIGGLLMTTAPIELKEGQKAPDFTATTDKGTTISLKDFKGKKHVVLYFYPKDDTPGCTKEACNFRDHIAKINKADAVILGVSRDSASSHRKFKDKYELPFTLLADEDESICKTYGTLKMKSMYGKSYLGVARMTFVIGKDGLIKKIFPNVNPAEHTEEVLTVLKEIK